MNLMKYFNYNYMNQNLKKSKSTLIFFLGIVPIISIITFLILINNNSFSSVTLGSISVVHYIGIYFIPIMISMCLFGFIYKKKSVDFINSMPLSRKTIFTTNTITGIILLVLMVLLSGLSIYFVSLFTNIILSFRMIIDYVLIWSITYIFVFVLSNIAASVAGNSITQVIVTLLLMFLIPFTVDYLVSSHIFNYGYDGGDICFEADNLIHEVCYYAGDKIPTTNYTLPYNNIHNFFIGNGTLYNTISLVKMLVLSIAGFIVGKMLFVKRKMEINETTFKSLKTHNIVKAFTMYPIVLLMFMMIPVDNLNIIILICCLLFLTVYFFIYDLITKKSISEVGTSIIHLVVTIAVLIPICIIINSNVYNYDREVYINSEDIGSFKLSLNSHDISEFDYVNVTDSKSIEMITNELLEGNNYEMGDTLSICEMIVTVDGKEYNFTGHFEQTSYEKIVKQIKSTDDIKNTKTLLDGNNNYAVSLNYENIRVMNNDSKLIDEVKRVIKNNISCGNNAYVTDIYLYNYSNGKVNTYEVSSCTSEIITKYVEEEVRKENARVLKQMKNLNYEEARDNGFTYKPSTLSSDYNVYDYGKEIYEFMKKYPNNDFTFDKGYITISGYFKGKEYIYHTNNISEYDKIFIEAK